MERQDFLALLAGRRGAVKGVLMDQSSIAGLGNLLCDEILWRARIDPFSAVDVLGERERNTIYDEMRAVLHESNRHGRVPPKESWLTGARDDREGACPRCGTGLRRGRLGGRTTCWCPRCQ
jgi:formamidopyrimidine-DNA glycosylase